MSSNNKMNLEIITPDKVAYRGEVSMVLARTVFGDIGILPNHEPLMAALDMAPIKIKIDKEEHLIAVFKGLMEVADNKVSILSSHVELPEEIDEERANNAKKRAEERLKQKGTPNIDFERAELALKRALTRLRTKGNMPM